MNAVFIDRRTRRYRVGLASYIVWGCSAVVVFKHFTYLKHPRNRFCSVFIAIYMKTEYNISVFNVWDKSNWTIFSIALPINGKNMVVVLAVLWFILAAMQV